jgi:hypothetical protein
MTVYLGSKSSAPSVDNDGDALTNWRSYILIHLLVILMFGMDQLG